jgi:hypothetical protein
MAHVLLIDDDPDLIAKQVRQAFLAACCQVALTATGDDGRRCVRAEQPDVILFSWTCAWRQSKAALPFRGICGSLRGIAARTPNGVGSGAAQAACRASGKVHSPERHSWSYGCWPRAHFGWDDV